MLCIESEWKNRTCSTDEDGYHGGESWLLQELTAFFKASNISTRWKSGPSLSRSLVVSHGCFLPMGLGHPLLLGSNRRISVAWIPYGTNEGLSGEGKASRRALGGCCLTMAGPALWTPPGSSWLGHGAEVLVISFHQSQLFSNPELTWRFAPRWDHFSGSSWDGSFHPD